MKNRSYKQRKRQKLRRHQIDDLLVDHTLKDLPNHKQENTSSTKIFFVLLVINPLISSNQRMILYLVIFQRTANAKMVYSYA